jgi:HD-like signal output (HDOD) protein
MGLLHRVEDLSHAIALLGSDEVRRIVAGAARGR